MTGPLPTTDHVEMVLATAYKLAGRDQAGAEDLLLGLADRWDSTAQMALAALGVSVDAVAQATRGQIRAGGTRVAVTVADVLDRARREAAAMGHQYVATDHVLLALVTQPETLAAQVLTQLGADEEQLRATVHHLLDAHPQARQSSHEPTVDEVVGGRRLALPAALDTYNEQIADARWQKELAVDDEDFTPAGAWRGEEKRLQAAKNDLIENWTASVGTTQLVDEIDRLYRQADQLRDLLHQHGIATDHLGPPSRGTGANHHRILRQQVPAPPGTPRHRPRPRRAQPDRPCTGSRQTSQVLLLSSGWL